VSKKVPKHPFFIGGKVAKEGLRESGSLRARGALTMDLASKKGFSSKKDTITDKKIVEKGVA